MHQGLIVCVDETVKHAPLSESSIAGVDFGDGESKTVMADVHIDADGNCRLVGQVREVIEAEEVDLEVTREYGADELQPSSRV